MKKPVANVDSLTVDHDIPLPEHKVMPGNKYGDLFAKLKPKSSIGCEPADVGRVQNALRKWLEVNNKADKFVVRSTKKHTDGRGRVWLALDRQGVRSVPRSPSSGVPACAGKALMLFDVTGLTAKGVLGAFLLPAETSADAVVKGMELGLVNHISAKPWTQSQSDANTRAADAHAAELEVRFPSSWGLA